MTSQSQALAQAAATKAVADAQNLALQSAVQAITSQQQFIINSFKGQIYISNQLDVQDTPVYDTITYAAGATINTPNSSFFTNVEANSGKTVAQTNMTQNTRLDAPEAFSVFGVRVGWSENILLSDLLTLLNGWAFEFYLGKKEYQRANLRHFSSGWGIAGMTTNTAESIYTNGWQSRDSMNVLAVKLVIANQMSFFAQLAGNSSQILSSAGTGMILVTELVGLYARGVQ
jgi:hypothetical protein